MKKKILLAVVVIALVLAVLTACNPKEEQAINVATLSGPSGMGMAYMFDNYALDINVFTAPDQITAKIIGKEIDIASVPANLAAVLYNKTNGGVKILSVNTTGMLYIIARKDANISSLADLAGKTVFATGKAATPEYAINEIKANNDVNFTVEYLAEHSQLATEMIQGSKELALLPEPFVSMVLAGNGTLERAIDLNEEWQAIYGADAAIPMTATIVRAEYLQANPDKVAAFADAYRASVEKVNGNPKEAAELIAENEVFANKAVSERAIPFCNIGYVDGEAMKAMLGDYFNVLFAANPQSVGGALPAADIYA